MQPKEFVSLAGSVAVVTGGGRGIGHAIVTSLAAMEATVVLTGRDEIRVQQVASDLQTGGHRAEGIGCDVTDMASVEALGERLRRNYGRVDILVNNAGIGGPRVYCMSLPLRTGRPFSIPTCAACTTCCAVSFR